VAPVVAEAERRLRELYLDTDDYINAIRTAYAEFKAHAASAWFAGASDEELRHAAHAAWLDAGGEWAFVPARERVGPDSMCDLLFDVCDASCNPWDPNAHYYVPDYETGTVVLSLPEDEDETHKQHPEPEDPDGWMEHHTPDTTSTLVP
jgi:hypothetical protein